MDLSAPFSTFFLSSITHSLWVVSLPPEHVPCCHMHWKVLWVVCERSKNLGVQGLGATIGPRDTLVLWLNLISLSDVNTLLTDWEMCRWRNEYGIHLSKNDRYSFRTEDWNVHRCHVSSCPDGTEWEEKESTTSWTHQAHPISGSLLLLFSLPKTFFPQICA